MDGVGDEFFAGSAFAEDQYCTVTGSKVADEFIDIAHSVVVANYSVETLRSLESGSQFGDFGDVMKAGEYALWLSLAIADSGNGHLDAAFVSVLCSDFDGIVECVDLRRAVITKRALVAAEPAVENVVAVSADNVLAVIACNSFGGEIEPMDNPIGIVDDDAVGEMVEYDAQLVLKMDHHVEITAFEEFAEAAL